MSNEISALLNIADRLRDIAERRRRPQKDPRPNINFRVEPEELIAIDNAAAARGLCRSDLIRDALQTIIGQSLRSRLAIPAGFQRRRKPDSERHKPTNSDVIELNRIATAAKIAASVARQAQRNDLGMMSERVANSSPKLRPR